MFHVNLANLSLETPKKGNLQPCRPRSHAAEWSGSPRFANRLASFSLKISKSHSLTYIKLKLNSSNVVCVCVSVGFIPSKMVQPMTIKEIINQPSLYRHLIQRQNSLL